MVRTHQPAIQRFPLLWHPSWLRMVTCSPSLKGRGFSVQPRSQRHESPKGLPGPLPLDRRVLVAVQDQPTGGAGMGVAGSASSA
jgi:hypothetical protein